MNKYQAKTILHENHKTVNQKFWAYKSSFNYALNVTQWWQRRLPNLFNLSWDVAVPYLEP